MQTVASVMASQGRLEFPRMNPLEDVIVPREVMLSTITTLLPCVEKSVTKSVWLGIPAWGLGTNLYCLASDKEARPIEKKITERARFTGNSRSRDHPRQYWRECVC